MLNTGVILAILSAVCIVAYLVITFEKKRNKPTYLKKLPNKSYEDDFIESIQKAYEVSGSINGMLLILKDQWKKGPGIKRIPAALDYLNQSRYKDYETTLSYLSDHTDRCDQVLQSILECEVRKQKALVCKDK